MRRIGTLALAGALSVTVQVGASAAPTNAQKCESAKLAAQARFAACRLRADAAYAKTLNAARRATTYGKCATALASAYTKLEAKYPVCPTMGDEASVDDFLEACTDKARDWTATTLASPLVFERFLATGQTTCWNTAGTVIACAGTGQDGDVRAGAALAYTDNGDGTVTDQNTGLQWEKKSDDGTIHDKDTTYTWANAFAVHVAGLNTASFAGHNDWRVPNLNELDSIRNLENVNPAVSPAFNTACAAPCTVLTCSCTGVLLPYWSSSTFANNPIGAWDVNPGVGANGAHDKTSDYYVRAVRGGHPT